MTPRSYAVLGCGAIGIFYGVHLARAGHPVHFVVRSDHAHVSRHGFRIDSSQGDLHLPRVRAYREPKEVPPCDVVLVALKTTAQAALADLLPPLVRPGTVVALLQNGLGIEARVERIVPDARLVGGLCFICVQRIGPGHVRHLDYGSVTLAAHAPRGGAAGIPAELEALRHDFTRAGVPVVLEPDLAAARWKKLVWNVPFNGLSVVLRATTRELVADPATRSLIEALMDEVRGAAAACGHPIPEGFAHDMMRMTDSMAPYAPSMRLDADAGRPLELDAIYAAPIAAARSIGYPTPRMEMLHRQLAFLDPRLRRA